MCCTGSVVKKSMVDCFASAWIFYLSNIDILQHKGIQYVATREEG
jgi:hypothetical protein